MAYWVKSVRVYRSYFGTKHFYRPMKWDLDGRGTYQAFPVQDEMELPTVWGYETEAEAWAVIDQQIDKEREPERFSYRDSGREDFHSDG